VRLLATLILFTFSISAFADSDRPNILFIMADDLGKEWLSCYGSEEHKTPHLDRLAEGGLRFQNAYATPLCTPTRHVLLTGRYPFRTGWTVHHDAPRWGGQYFDWKREITFARLLKSAGYATAIAGKWQVNDLRTHPDALWHHGFDEHCVWTGFETGNPPSAERYFNPFIQHNGPRRTYANRFGPDIFLEFLTDFITRNKDRSFCAYYAMVLPHTPFTKTPHNLNSTAEGIPLFPGMVDYVDYLVGCLVKTLDRLKISEKTVVIFTADNGTVSGVKCRVNGREVNGGKASLSESGICVPFIANCPSLIPGGRVTSDLIDFADIMPTLVELVGAELPRGVTIDGRSFVGTLLNKCDSKPRREWIYSQLGSKRVLRDKKYKLYWDGRFYNILKDPAERNDLADKDEPEIAAARVRLKTVLDSFPADAKLPFQPRKSQMSKTVGRPDRASKPE